MRHSAMRHTGTHGETTGRRGLNVAVLGLTAGLAMLAAPAQAQEAPAAGSIVSQLYACRTISDPAQRLACFDREVAALETAQTNNEVRIVDREQVRQARRGLFGLSLPNLGNIFGGGGDDDANEAPAEEEGITFIESRITSIGGDSGGRRLLVLENGQQWVQIEPHRGRAPIAGAPITIRRGLLGSYVATVEGRGTLRVMRTR